MKFIVNKKTFAEALTHVASVAPTSSAHPALHNVMLSASGEAVVLSATDLEVAIRTPVAATVQAEGEILLPAKKLLELIKRIACEEIVVDVQEGVAHITGGGKFRLSGMDTGEFPTFPEYEKDGVVAIPPAIFRSLVANTIFCVSKGDTRYALSGVNVSIAEDGLVEFAGSDTHRLSVESFQTDGTPDRSRNEVVPAKGIALMARMADGQAWVELSLSRNGAVATMDGTTVFSRVVEGMFPRYGEIAKLPEKSNAVTMDRAELVRSLGAVGVLANSESHGVTMAIGADRVILSSDAEGNGGAIRLDAELKGEPGESIKINHLFLSEVLRLVSSEKVSILFTDASSPIFLIWGRFTHVIMPIDV